MAKHFIKKAVLLFIVAIMVITPVLGYANTVYARTDDALDEIKGIFEGYNSRRKTHTLACGMKAASFNK